MYECVGYRCPKIKRSDNMNIPCLNTAQTWSFSRISLYAISFTSFQLQHFRPNSCLQVLLFHVSRFLFLFAIQPSDCRKIQPTNATRIFAKLSFGFWRDTQLRVFMVSVLFFRCPILVIIILDFSSFSPSLGTT